MHAFIQACMCSHTSCLCPTSRLSSVQLPYTHTHERTHTRFAGGWVGRTYSSTDAYGRVRTRTCVRTSACDALVGWLVLAFGEGRWTDGRSCDVRMEPHRVCKLTHGDNARGTLVPYTRRCGRHAATRVRRTWFQRVSASPGPRNFGWIWSRLGSQGSVTTLLLAGAQNRSACCC